MEIADISFCFDNWDIIKLMETRG